MLSQDQLVSLVYLTFTDPNVTIEVPQDLVAKLRLRRTPVVQISTAAFQLGFFAPETLPPVKRKGKGSRHKLHQGNRAGSLNGRAREEELKWKESTWVEKREFVRAMRVVEAAPPEPSMIVGMPIVRPQTGDSYFADTAAIIAKEAREEAALAVVGKWVSNIHKKSGTAAGRSATHSGGPITAGRAFIEEIVTQLGERSARTLPLSAWARPSPGRQPAEAASNGVGHKEQRTEVV